MTTLRMEWVVDIMVQKDDRRISFRDHEARVSSLNYRPIDVDRSCLADKRDLRPSSPSPKSTGIHDV